MFNYFYLSIFYVFFPKSIFSLPYFMYNQNFGNNLFFTLAVLQFLATAGSPNPTEQSLTLNKPNLT